MKSGLNQRERFWSLSTRSLRQGNWSLKDCIPGQAPFLIQKRNHNCRSECLGGLGLSLSLILIRAEITLAFFNRVNCIGYYNSSWNHSFKKSHHSFWYNPWEQGLSPCAWYGCELDSFCHSFKTVMPSNQKRSDSRPRVTPLPLKT